MFKNIDKTIIECEYILQKHKNKKILKNEEFYNTCLCNIYYNYSKYYIIFSEFNKSKKLLFKILRIKFNYKKNYLVLLFLIFLYLYPNFIKNKLKIKYLNK